MFYHIHITHGIFDVIHGDKRLFPSVHAGDGKSIPVTNTGHSIIPSHHRPIHFHNVLDYLTRHILLRCDSLGDLYPVTKPSTLPIAFLSTTYCSLFVIFFFVALSGYLCIVVMVAVAINTLDAGNPLFLQNNDHYNVPLIGFKLTGTEYYKMWSTAMNIALTGKNKFGFVDGTYVKPVTSLVLAQQWERCNAIVLGWILSSLSPYLYLGQVYSQIASEFLMGLNDVYQNIRSNILARDPLPDVKEAFNVVSREESHRGLHPGTRSGSGNKVQPAALVVKSNNFRGMNLEGGGNSFSNSNGKVYNNNTEASKGASTSSGSTSFDTQFTKEQMMKILSLINEKLSGNANANMAGMRPTFFNGNVLFNMHFEKFFCAHTYSYMYNLTLGWIIDSRANQHLTNSTKDKFNVYDISSLNLTVGHPNGTLAKISAILVLTWVDLNLVKTLGTSSKADGLYTFDVDQIGKSNAGSANSTFLLTGSFPTPWFGGGESDEVEVEGVGVGRRGLLPLDLSRKTLFGEHGIKESHFATLSHTYHSMSNIVSKIEVFANGETIEHVAQGCIGVIIVTGEAYGIFTDDGAPLLEFIF
ncbi:ribonuclease H-like domain-containing protein [Tanacetum coccineum]